MSTLATSHGNIAFKESSGSGPAVLFIHGNSACKEVFDLQLDGASGHRYRMIAFDLPGHGESSDAPEPEHSYHIAAYADVALMLLEHLGARRCAVVGWSLGGLRRRDDGDCRGLHAACGSTYGRTGPPHHDGRGSGGASRRSANAGGDIACSPGGGHWGRRALREQCLPGDPELRQSMGEPDTRHRRFGTCPIPGCPRGVRPLTREISGRGAFRSMTIRKPTCRAIRPGASRGMPWHLPCDPPKSSRAFESNR